MRRPLHPRHPIGPVVLLLLERPVGMVAAPHADLPAVDVLALVDELAGGEPPPPRTHLHVAHERALLQRTAAFAPPAPVAVERAVEPRADGLQLPVAVPDPPDALLHAVLVLALRRDPAVREVLLPRSVLAALLVEGVRRRRLARSLRLPRCSARGIRHRQSRLRFTSLESTIALRVWSTLGAMRTRSRASSRRGDVAGAHVHDRVGAARHGAGVDDLGHTLQDALQLVGGDGSAAEQLDVRLGRHAVDGGVDLDGERADDPVGDEAVDATLHSRRRQAHRRPDVAIARARVLAEQVEDGAIEVVHSRSVRRFVAFSQHCTRISCARPDGLDRLPRLER